MQFYILFPLFLFVINKFLKKIFLWILIFLIFSYLISIVLFLKLPHLNFYFLPSRGWEFLLGTIIAYFHIKNLLTNIVTKHSELVINLSLLTILFSFFF